MHHLLTATLRSGRGIPALLLIAAACSSDSAAPVIPPPTTDSTVAQLKLSPDSTAVMSGTQVRLAATALDVLGHLLSGVTFTWTSSDSTVATVSGDGLVTARAEGFVTITVSSSGRTAFASIIVKPRDNTMNQTFQDDFETGNYLRVQGGGTWVGGGSGNVNVGRGGFGSNYALTLTHRGKPSDGMSTAEQRFRLSRGVPELWMQYDFMVPSNFYHRFSTDGAKSDNNKFLALWEENYSGVAADSVTPTPLLILEFRPMNDGPTHIGEAGSAYLYLHGHDRTGRLIGLIGSPWLSAFGSWNRGQWIQIRVHVKMATDDVTDNGVIEVFADQKPVISVSNFRLHSSASGHYIKNGYFMGWSNSGFDQDTEFRIDNVKFYASNPGW